MTPEAFYKWCTERIISAINFKAGFFKSFCKPVYPSEFRRALEEAYDLGIEEGIERAGGYVLDTCIRCKENLIREPGKFWCKPCLDKRRNKNKGEQSMKITNKYQNLVEYQSVPVNEVFIYERSNYLKTNTSFKAVNLDTGEVALFNGHNLVIPMLAEIIIHGPKAIDDNRCRECNGTGKAELGLAPNCEICNGKGKL